MENARRCVHAHMCGMCVLCVCVCVHAHKGMLASKRIFTKTFQQLK